jgi:hypothetical protein
MNKIYRLLVIILGFLTAGSSAAFAQITYTGTVLGKDNIPLENAAVLIVKSDSSTVIRYTLSNSTGQFTLACPSIADQQYIKISAYGYKTYITALNPVNRSLQIQMQEQTTMLKEVNIIKQAPLVKRGDTLNYDVKTFSKGQDRVIGDVIRNLPGIKINPDGQIIYNGRAINKFYIEGDDLLDNKYNLASNAIPADAVEKVQILEDHQPVNTLRDIVRSNNAALNLKLKKTAKFKVFGVAETGVGLPDAYNLNTDLMLFKDNFKTLNKLSYNSTGLDLSYNLKSHSLEDLFDSFDLPLNGQQISTRTIPDPPIQQNRWLLNKTGLLTGNTLLKLGKDESLRINAWYLPSQTNQNYNAETRYTLPDSSYRQYESQQIKTTGKEIYGSLDYKSNKKKFYLENKLDVELKDETLNGTLQTERTSAMQNSDFDRRKLENNFRLVKTAGKRLILELFSKSGYISSPEELYITPGIYETILNQNRPYQRSLQEINKEALYSRNSASLRVSSAKLKQHYELGYHYEAVNLQSGTSVRNSENRDIELNDAYQNDLEWRSGQTRFTAGYTYTLKNLSISTSLPLSYRNIQSRDLLRQQDTTINKLIFEPTLNFKLVLSPKQSLQLGLNRGVNFGKPEDMLSGYVIRNYRTIRQNSFILNQGKQYSGNIFYSYREPVKIFFTSIGATYSRGSNNTMMSSVVQGDGLVKTDRILFDNINERLTAMGNISKYIFDWKSTVRLGLNWSQFSESQIQNSSIIPVKNQSVNYELEFDAKLSERFNFNYSGSYQLSRAVSKKTLINALSNKVRSASQKLTVTYFIKPELYVQCYNEYRLLQSYRSKGNVYFNDLKIQYSLPNTKTDIGLSLSNTFNKKSYLYESLDFTSSVIQNYILRPRTIFLNVRFVL